MKDEPSVISDGSFSLIFEGYFDGMSARVKKKNDQSIINKQEQKPIFVREMRHNR